MPATTTHKLTNGQTNWVYRITGDQAVVITVERFGEVTREDMGRAEARQHYALAKEFGCTVGATRLFARRRITSPERLAAYLAQAYDLEGDDNAPEAVLALEQEFAEVGFLTVPA